MKPLKNTTTHIHNHTQEHNNRVSHPYPVNRDLKRQMNRLLEMEEISLFLSSLTLLSISFSFSLSLSQMKYVSNLEEKKIDL